MNWQIETAARRTIRARNLAAADQALAFLRDQGGFPYSTGELAEQFFNFPVGWWKTFRCECGFMHRHWHDAGRHRPESPTCRNQMLRLVRLGLVEQVKVESDRRLFWRAGRG